MKKPSEEQVNDPNTLCIYTDGSGIAEHIGAAVYSPTTQSTDHEYLGRHDTTNVYSAELTGIHPAMNMAERSPTHFLKCAIYVDSQSSIQAVNKPKQQSGQYIIANIYHRLDEIKQQRPDLSFQIGWVPGHMDILGNEKADEEAKKAAKEKLTGENPLLHRNLKSAQLAKINTDIMTAAKTAWNHGTTNANQLRKISRPQGQNGDTIIRKPHSKASINAGQTSYWPLSIKPIPKPVQHRRRPNMRMRTRNRKC